MYGAILGDMIGAPYEFDRGRKTKDFPLFSERSQFTDDTVMTIAVAQALLSVGKDADDETVRHAVTGSMRTWGRKYPDAGYGGRFRGWLMSGDPKPYGSWGNGSAMRVSPTGWLYDSLEETRRIARLTAQVTHNHPEGIKGAEATASAIYLARTGSCKEEIREYIVNTFGYNLSRTCDEIRPGYHHEESCQETVPEAITAFLEGESFEDVIRTAVSLGGDCDTLTCIAGGIAEAFYGVPVLYEAQCKARLPQEMADVLEAFDIARGRTQTSEDPREENRRIERAIENYHKAQNRETILAVLQSILLSMRHDGQFIVPVIPPQAALDMLDVERVRVGDEVMSDEELHFKLNTITADDGKTWFAAFTSYEECEKGESTSTMTLDVGDMLRNCREAAEEGIIINPWDKPFVLTKELIRVILDADQPEQ